MGESGNQDGPGDWRGAPGQPSGAGADPFGAGGGGDWSWNAPPSGAPPPAGPMWEDLSRGLVERFVGTVKPVFSSPSQFFETMPAEGGIGQPLAFGVIAMTLGMIMQGVYSIFTRALLSAIGMAVEQGQADEQVFTLLGGMAGNACMIVLAPLWAVIGIFIGTAIVHVCLMLVGGATRPFEATFRTVCYASAISLLNVIPVCGGLIAWVWTTVVEIIGLSRVHQIGAGKAAIAVLLPTIVCCLCAVVVGVGAVAIIAAAAGGAHPPAEAFPMIP